MTRLAFALLTALWSVGAAADEIRMAVTTSFQNSGLSDILIPEIRKDTGLKVHLLVVGTGQALRLGRAGDVDAVLVHSREAEERFVTEGYGTHRREIMYNDFVLVGPAGDPAGAAGSSGIAEALTAVADARSVFVSRGDDSGTHRRERALWDRAGIDIDLSGLFWYREVGAGMGAALNIAAAMGAYVLVDRASWLNFANGKDLGIVFQNDPALFNQYAYLPVDPLRHPHIRSDEAARLERWLVSPKAQALIGSYMIAGEALFVPNAKAEADAVDG